MNEHFLRQIVLSIAALFFASTAAAPIKPTAIRYQADHSSADLKSGHVTLEGNVQVEGEDFRLEAAWGEYSSSPEKLLVGGGVFGVWRGDSVSSVEARVVPDDSLVQLTGSVRLFGKDSSLLRCSHLSYSRFTGIARLSGPVMLEDSTSTYSARSDTGWFVETQEILQLARSCTLFIYDSEGEAIEVHSDSVLFDNISNKMVANGNVSFTGHDLDGGCEIMEYSRADDRVVLRGGAPWIRSQTVRCNAGRIVLQRSGGILKQAVLEREAFASRTSSDADSLSSNQIWGDRMVLWLKHGDPSSILVSGQAKATHTVLDSEGISVGVNTAEGDTLFMGLKEQGLTDIRVSGHSKGVYKPETRTKDMPGEEIRYAAKTIEFDAENDLLLMSGSAQLESGTAKLTASLIKLSVSKEELVAKENAVLIDKDQEIEGDAMTFDLSKRQGVVREGTTQFEKAFSFGKRVARLSNKKLSIQQGRFTSCDLDHPHFYITSPRMRVKMNDKVVGRPITLWIHDVPVFWLPYWVFPIRKGRHSGFLVPSFSFQNVVGLEGSHTRIRDIGYYFVLGDYADATLSLDWEEGLDWTFHGKTNYALRYRMKGTLNTRFARHENSTVWFVQETHNQFLPYGWRLTANIRATGSKEFIDQQTDDLDDRLDQNAGLNSDITLTKNLGGWNVRASLRRDQSWDTETVGDTLTTTTETISTTLPDISVSRPSKRIFSSNKGTVPWFKEIYASLSSSFRNRTTLTENDETEEQHTAGTTHAVNLSWHLPKIMQKFNLSPRASYQEVWVHMGQESSTGDRMENDRRGVIHGIGVSASTKLYGLLQPPIGPVEAFRHVMTPQVTYSYTPDWFIYGWDFDIGRFSEGDNDPFQESGFGSSFSEGKRLGLSLNNVFQAKIRRGEDVVRKDNLASLNFSTSYDLKKKSDDEDPWSTLSTTFNFSPGMGLSWSLRTTHDPNRNLAFGTLSSTASARLNGGWDRPLMVGKNGQITEDFRYKWSASATHTYSHTKGSTEDPQTLKLALKLSPSVGWADVRAAVNYDIRDQRVLSKTLSIVRDLHCWQMDFSWSQTDVHWNYGFKVFVKAYPQSLFVEHKERG